MWTVRTVFEDGSSDLTGERYIDLGEATISALRLADIAGKDPNVGSRGRMVMVRILADERTELLITVLKGGLIPSGDPESIARP